MKQVSTRQALEFEHRLNPQVQTGSISLANETISALIEALDQTRQVAFVNLLDALGESWVLNHQGLLKELQQGHWKKASWMVMCSPLADICPGRAYRIASAIADANLSEYLSAS
ncbi:hypothetical protein [Dongshaea marina]|uniref:hypothetical protein n=1 Tax=Dongshaea marina TaxID=2047966 RepID=UPI000D3E16A1|nr:hypothetical protein [Dongshaea marina]